MVSIRQLTDSTAATSQNKAIRSFPCFIFMKSDQSQEVEETLKRIQQHKGVVGTIVVNNEGESINLAMKLIMHQNWTKVQSNFCEIIDQTGNLFTFFVVKGSMFPW